jgi:AAA+ ATPase superfamily predicted ATPase
MMISSFTEVYMFVGRKPELAVLESFVAKKRSSFLLIKGRRRIGKSTLVKEYCRRKKIQLFEFQGLAPGQGINNHHQLANYQNTLAEYLQVKSIEFSDWQRGLESLAKLSFKKKAVVLLDEISWMGQYDDTFPSQLKSAWDRTLKEIPNLILIVSGSVSSWIEENISKNTGFVGRVSSEIELKELSISDCFEYGKANNQHLRIADFWKLISITGGVPKYLEEIDFKNTPEQNIKKNFMNSSGFFFSEFDKIFSDIFQKRGVIYKKILREIGSGHYSPSELAVKLEIPLNKDFSKSIFELESAGFISRDYTWSFKSGKSKLSHLRLSDNYSRFYLRYIEKNSERLRKLPMKTSSSLQVIPWDILFGLQFENLVMNNLSLIVDWLELSPDEIVNIGPFFQPSTRGRKGVQIDLMIQTRYKNLYICEVKTQESLNTKAIEEMSLKIKNLEKPRGFAIHPCLITIHNPPEVIVDSDYFHKIINMSEKTLEAF